MRRKDREMSEEFAYEVVDSCEYAVLSMLDIEGEPYCVPITIVREGENVYFHSAMEGQKIDCLKAHNRVCIACVGNTSIQQDKFTTKYESAIVRGSASEVTVIEEKIHVLRILCQRHTPANMAEFDAAIERSLSRTGIWKIRIGEITGKAKR